MFDWKKKIRDSNMQGRHEALLVARDMAERQADLVCYPGEHIKHWIVRFKGGNCRTVNRLSIHVLLKLELISYSGLESGQEIYTWVPALLEEKKGGDE